MPKKIHSAGADSGPLSEGTVEVLRSRGLLSPEQLAEYLGIPLATVYRWRARRTGPPGLRVGRHVRYRASAVEGWLDAQADHADPAA